MTKRVSGTQAVFLDMDFRFGGAQLSPLLTFIAIAETRAHPLPRVFEVEHLSSLVGPHSRDMLYCPVRVLTEYVSRIKTLRSGHRLLFCSATNPSRPLS